MSDEIKTSTASAPKGLVVKLCEIMAAIHWVEKRGRNEFHKYDYATEADLVESVRGHLAERRVFIFPNVRSHSRSTDGITDIMVEWTFVDGDTGETYSCNIPGAGQDKGDKGVYKALTGSEKYLLMKAFLIPTGDDPEADTKAERAKLKEASPTTAQPQKNGDIGAPNIALAPGKEGFRTITGNGLPILLSELYETEKTLLGLAYDGNFWTVPIAQAFRFADACTKHGVGVVHMDSSAAKPPAPNGGGAQPSPASPSKIIKATYPKSGTTKSTKEKPAREWACLEVIWDNEKFLCWDKTLWPYLEDAGRKKLTALLQTTKSFDGKKSPTIDAILQIGETEFEVIEGRCVPVIQREAGNRE